MRRTYRRSGGPLLCAALVSPLLISALAGCGSSAAKLNTVAVERAIAGAILTQRHIHSLVSCPAGIPQQKGRTFTCEAKLTAGEYPMYVTEIDGSGHVRYGNKAALVALDTAKVEHAIEASILAQRKLHAHVVCPAGVLQQKSLVFTCTARVGAKSYPFGVTEVDGNGHVRYIGR